MNVILALLAHLRSSCHKLLSCLTPKTHVKDVLPLTLSWQPDAASLQVDERYLSYSIDISVFAGGFWWEGVRRARRGMGTLPVPALAMANKKLGRLTAALGPAYLRIGGSEADKIHYFELPEDEPDALLLSKAQWDDLHTFINTHKLKLIFTCKYGLFHRRWHGNWQGSELTTLLEYSRDNKYRIDVFELGNELNAYWAFHGLRSQPSARSLASDYDSFGELVRSYYPEAKISGPGSAFWPRLGEAVSPRGSLTPRFLASLSREIDIIDWHYYPFQSDRSPVKTRAAKLQNLLNPKSFAYYARYSRRLAKLRDRFAPGAELWTGETGSAQCGGQPFLSDRFASSFWWADQLGMGASHGQRVMVRQSLIGGDYGLIDRLTLKPRPDYWLSWMWQQLMGDRVWRIVSPDPRLRSYLHRHRNERDFTLLLINLHPSPVTIANTDLGEVQAQYVLSAKRLSARKLRINGVRPRVRRGKVQLADFPQAEHTRVLAPQSIHFWVLRDGDQFGSGLAHVADDGDEVT